MLKLMSALIALAIINTTIFSNDDLQNLPESLEILANPLKRNVNFPQELQGKTNWMPTNEDLERGFTVGLTDPEVDLTPAWVWDSPVLEKNIKIFAARGEYSFISMAVRSTQLIQKLDIKISDFKCGDKIISSKNVSVFIVPWEKTKKNNRIIWKGRFIDRLTPFDMPANSTAWIWIQVCVPENTPAGVYSATVTVSDERGKNETLPFKLRVMSWDFQYAPSGLRGMYIPGHLANPRPSYAPRSGAYRPFCSKEFRKQNLIKYFKFWKTRGFNSPNIYHIYPALSCIDGDAKADFSELSDIVDAIKQVGLEGSIVLDTRHISYWANAAAEKLHKLRQEGKSVSGDIGIYGQNGIISRDVYCDDAKRLYAQVIRQLTTLAQRDNWPPYLLFPEEEISNGGIKLVGYDSFMPVLRTVAGEDKVIVMDNEIGYGKKNPIDRGHRDKILIRVYNSWTQQSIDEAKKDSAMIMTFNIGWKRVSWGIYQLRVSSEGGSSFQWADQWCDSTVGGDYSGAEWLACKIMPTGIVTSVDIERAHAGICDYAYFDKLAKLIGQCKAKGLVEPAVEAQKVLDLVISDVQPEKREFLDYAGSQLSYDELETRKWAVAMEIEKLNNILSGALSSEARQNEIKSVPKILAISSDAHIINTLNTQRDKTLQAVFANDIKLDGNGKELCWKQTANKSSPLYWTKSKEILLRKRAGNTDELKDISVPSYSAASVAYNNEGMYFFLTVNHINPKTSNSIHNSGDGDIWKDDCMELFFLIPQHPQKIYQLIVNAKGAHTFYGVAPELNSKIAVVTKSFEKNALLGYYQEIFIPWELFGLNSAPAFSTKWYFNIGREFHSWNEFTTWSQVYSSFQEPDAMGSLVFAGPAGGVSLENIKLGLRYPGENEISGKIKFNEFIRDALVRLCNESGKTMAEVNVSSINNAFMLKYFIATKDALKQWQLEVIHNDKKIASMPVMIPSCFPSLMIKRMRHTITSGQLLTIDAELRTAKQKNKINVMLTNVKGEKINLLPFMTKEKGPIKIYLSTEGMPAGNYTLSIWLDENTDSPVIANLTILASSI